MVYWGVACFHFWVNRGEGRVGRLLYHFGVKILDPEAEVQTLGLVDMSEVVFHCRLQGGGLGAWEREVVDLALVSGRARIVARRTVGVRGIPLGV